MPFTQENESNKSIRPATSGELNSWKRGFTPQAEIWNGRMAIAGLVVFFVVLVLSNLILS